jgi:hypothetical protein
MFEVVDCRLMTSLLQNTPFFDVSLCYVLFYWGTIHHYCSSAVVFFRNVSSVWSHFAEMPVSRRSITEFCQWSLFLFACFRNSRKLCVSSRDVNEITACLLNKHYVSLVMPMQFLTSVVLFPLMFCSDVRFRHIYTPKVVVLLRCYSDTSSDACTFRAWLLLLHHARGLSSYRLLHVDFCLGGTVLVSRF